MTRSLCRNLSWTLIVPFPGLGDLVHDHDNDLVTYHINYYSTLENHLEAATLAVTGIPQYAPAPWSRIGSQFTSWMQLKVLIITYNALNGTEPSYFWDHLYLFAHPTRFHRVNMLWIPLNDPIWWDPGSMYFSPRWRRA